MRDPCQFCRAAASDRATQLLKQHSQRMRLEIWKLWVCGIFGMFSEACCRGASVGELVSCLEAPWRFIRPPLHPPAVAIRGVDFIICCWHKTLGTKGSGWLACSDYGTKRMQNSVLQGTTTLVVSYIYIYIHSTP